MPRVFSKVQYLRYFCFGMTRQRFQRASSTDLVMPCLSNKVQKKGEDSGQKDGDHCCHLTLESERLETAKRKWIKERCFGPGMCVASLN